MLSAAEQVEIFGNEWQPSWVAEAHERWGDTAQWAQYAERVAGKTGGRSRTVRRVADPGFAAYYDALAPGLSSWLSDINADAQARGIDPKTATLT